MDMKEKLVEVFCSALGVESDFQNAEAMAFVEELIANGVTVQEWISVKDRLPTMDSIVEKDFVLVCTENNEHLIVAVADVWRFRDFITHWMPLPELPKGE